jgi:hypothetical protein
MDRKTANLILSEMEAALKPVVERHGLTITKRSGSFDFTSLRLRVDAVEAETAKKQVAAALSSVGVKTDHEFTFAGRTYKVTGTRRGRDFDWVLAARQPDGRMFRFRPEQVPA